MLREVIRLAPDGQPMAFEPLSHIYETLAREFPQVDVWLADEVVGDYRRVRL